MSNNEFKELFLKDSLDKQLNIVFDGGTITNAELHSNQFELTESICSDTELRFGGCEASVVKFKVSNVFSSLKGKEIDISMFIGGNMTEPYRFGKFKVESDTPTADRAFKDIVAYDKMYEIINADVAEWYNSLTFPMSLRDFRTSFVSHFGLEQVEITLPNDDMTVEKTIETVELSGKAVAMAICEINGCFGRINRNDQFEYVVLPEIKFIYPQNTLFPSNDLFAMDILNDGSAISKNHYISCQYEDFKTRKIDGIDVWEDGESIGNVLNSGENVYVIQDNFLIYGKSTEELTAILTDLLNAISVIQYRPANILAIGNPAISLGEPIRLTTKYQAINTYVLNRTITGIQGLKDNYVTTGVEYYEKNLNSSKNEILKLKSKTNKLTRNIEETVSKIEDVEKQLSTEITQTAQGLTIKIENADTKAADAQSKAELAQGEAQNANNKASSAEGKAQDAMNSANEAYKYATNYLDLSSLGLIVGNMVAEILGKNVLIGADSVSIRDGDTILADYSVDKVRLGINSESSIVEFCGGKGYVKYGTNTIDAGNQLMLGSDEKLTLFADKQVILFGGKVDESQTGQASQVTVLENELALTSAVLENGVMTSMDILVQPSKIKLGNLYRTGPVMEISETAINFDGAINFMEETSFGDNVKMLYSEEDKTFSIMSKIDDVYKETVSIDSSTGNVAFNRDVTIAGNFTVNGTDLDLDSVTRGGSLYASTLEDFVWGVYQAGPSTMCYSGRVKDEGGWGPNGFACWYQFYAIMQNAPNGNYSVDVFTILQYGNDTFIGCINGTTSFAVTWKKLAKVVSNSVWDNPSQQKLYIAAGNESDYRLFLGVADSNWVLCPSVDGYLRCGTASFRWGQVYAKSSAISTSDRNVKKEIQPLTDKHVKFFMMLQPVSFQFIDGTSGRTHIGFVSQDVEEAMIACGLTDLDFAGFCKDQKYENVTLADGTVEQRIVEGVFIYSLRYEEFIALNTHVIQKLYSDMELIKSKLEVC